MSDEAPVSNEDLDAAWPVKDKQDDAVEDHSADGKEDDKDVEEETKQPDVKQTEDELEEEPVDNAERSRLGRRVSSLDERLDKLSMLVEQGFRNLVKPKEEEEEPEDDLFGTDEDEDKPLTKRELAEFLERRERARYKAHEQYANTYRNAVNDYLSKINDEDVRNAVLEEFKEKYNKRLSDNGANDGLNNIRTAHIEILQGLTSKIKEKQNPFEKNTDTEEEVALGGKTNQSNKLSKERKKIKLDAAAAEYAAAVGMSEDDVQEALQGEAPAYLQGKS